MSNLARFRADPAKVRVAIRYTDLPGRWIVTVTERDTGEYVSVDGRYPSKLVTRALKVAASRMKGIDLDMQWTYPHPQKRSA